MSHPSRSKRSRPSGTSRRTLLEQSLEEFERFTSEENKSWYDSHKLNKILVEKRVHPDVERIYELRLAFDIMGWGPILTLEGEYFPMLVRQFYANMVDKEVVGLCDIRSFVKGQPITITEESLSDLLGITVDGLRYNIRRGDRVIAEARNRLSLRWVFRHHSRNVIPVKDLDIRSRLLVYLMGFNVMPRASGLNEMRGSDIYLLDKMLNPRDPPTKISLLSIIIQQMRDVCRNQLSSKNLVFPLVLTRVFRAHGVSFDNEERVLSGMSDVINANTMLSLGYTWVEEGRTWIDLYAAQPRGLQEPVVRRGPRGAHDDGLAEEAELDARDAGNDPSTSTTTSRAPPRGAQSAIIQMLQKIQQTQQQILERMDRQDARLDEIYKAVFRDAGDQL